MQVVAVILIVGVALFYVIRKIARQFGKNGGQDGGCHKCDH